MPIVAGDIDFHLSGGAGNSDPDASLGGIISATQITDATTHNLFDIVSSAEASAGDTEYRCFYAKNNHGSLTLQNAEVWVQTATPSTDTDIEIGLDLAGIGDGSTTGVADTVANESTAPSPAVTFSTALGSGNAISIGNISSGDCQAIWVKRIVSSSASAYTDDSVVIRISGDTAA
jgi:hypothetical protein